MQCVPIAPGRVDTLRDHHLSGLLDLDLPAGFAAIDVRGVRSDDDGCAADTVFHGEGYYGGGWTVDVPLTHALDCRDFTTSPTAAQLLDLAKLEAGAADRCAPPANASGYQVFLQHQYPYDLSGDLYLDFPLPLSVQPITGIFYDVLRQNLPAGSCDAEFYGAQPCTVFVDWRYAQRAEAIANLFWPGLQVKASANPRYQGCDQWVTLTKTLAEARKAVMAAEAAVRCGVAT